MPTVGELEQSSGEDRGAPTPEVGDTKPSADGRWARYRRHLRSARASEDPLGSRVGQRIEHWLRIGVLIGLLIAAIATFADALSSFTGRTLPVFMRDIVPTWLNAALLIFIVLELAQTVRQQLEAKERLSGGLIRNIVAIGVLSSVRHLLSVGAKMTLEDPQRPGWPIRRGEIIELAVSAAIVVVLVIGWRLAGGSTQSEVSAA